MADTARINWFPAGIRQGAADHALDIPGMPPGFGQPIIPHHLTTAARYQAGYQTYYSGDEAIRDSRQNAIYMRQHTGIRECLLRRQEATALLNWHLQPEDEDDPRQKELCVRLTQILERTKRFTEMRRGLGEAIWYGRAGVQMVYKRVKVRGEYASVIREWYPVNGDKLAFRFDDGRMDAIQGDVGIRVSSSMNAELKKRLEADYGEGKIHPTERGWAYFMDSSERKRFLLHKYLIEDGPYDDGRQADKVNGVGVRDLVYWTWLQMLDVQSWMMDFLQRSGMGIEVWKYPANNAEAKAACEAAARNRTDVSILTVPVWPGDEVGAYDVEFKEPGFAGVEAVKDLLQSYYLSQIKRLILGQNLTTESDATGLGSGVSDAHMATWSDIIRCDARGLEEDITDELVEPLKLFNAPWARDIHVRFVIDTEGDDAQNKMDAWRQAYDMGLSIKADDVRDLIGASKPDPEDEVLKSPISEDPSTSFFGGFGDGPNGGGQEPEGGPGDNGPDDGGDEPGGPISGMGPKADQFMAKLKGKYGATSEPSGPEKYARDYSSTQVNLEGDAALSVSQLANQVADLAESMGVLLEREEEPHITVKYGLHTNDPAKVRDAIADCCDGPILATLGDVSLFENDEFDVVKLDIESDDLRRLNAALRDSLENTETYPEYKPHITLAYVKPGKGQDVADEIISTITGDVLEFDSVTFSNKRREQTKIPLGGTEKYAKKFDESKHPRAGKGEGGGQFVPLAGQKDFFGGQVSEEEAEEKQAKVDAENKAAKADAAKEKRDAAKAEKANQRTAFDQGKLFQNDEQGGLFDKVYEPKKEESKPAVNPHVHDEDAARKAGIADELKNLGLRLAAGRFAATGKYRVEGDGKDDHSNFFADPAEALDHYHDRKKKIAENTRRAGERSSLVDQIKAAGEVTDDQAKQLLDGGSHGSKSKLSWVLRELGLSAKEAKRIVDTQPMAWETSGGAVMLAGAATINRGLKKFGGSAEPASEPKPAPRVTGNTQKRLFSRRGSYDVHADGDMVLIQYARKPGQGQKSLFGDTKAGGGQKSLFDDRKPKQAPKNPEFEKDHPRDDDGTFVEKEGGASGDVFHERFTEEVEHPGSEESPKNTGETTVPGVEQQPPASDHSEEPAELPSYTLEHHKGNRQRIFSGEMTADEIRASFDNAVAHKEEIQAELNKLTKKDLARLANRYIDRDDKKADLVKAAYEQVLEDHFMGTSMQWNPMSETHAEALQRVVHAQTDEMVQKGAEEIKRQRAEYLERVGALKKAITDPETLEEFRTFVERKGEDALSTEQKRKREELEAAASKTKRREKKQESATIEKIEGDGVQFGLKEGYHDKKNVPLHIVQLQGERLDREKFNELKAKAKRMGGWWSSFKKSDAGFQFYDKETAEQFMGLTEGDISGEDRHAERQERKQQTAADRLRELADAAEERANEKLGADRKANTAKRAQEAAYAEADARAELAHAETMRRIAEGHESGEVKYLDGIRTRSHIDQLERIMRRAASRRNVADDISYSESQGRDWDEFDIDHAEFPHPSVHKDHIKRLAQYAEKVKGGKQVANAMKKAVDALGENEWQVRFKSPYDRDRLAKFLDAAERGGASRWDTSMARDDLREQTRMQQMDIQSDHELRQALREYLPIRGKKGSEDPVKKAERALVGRKIPGFFPTPPSVIDQMVGRAGISAGHKVLEPSAGKGDIIDAIKDHQPDASVKAIERSRELQDVLGAKGYDVDFSDFMDHRGEYDRIVMNPPFENGQDAEHVQHAFQNLKPGGRVVAVMSSGPFQRSDKKSQAFRDWLDEVGGEVEDLPQGSFKGMDAFRQTGVNTKLVVIDK